jgi:hydroxyacylglutathione hydrolase
VGQVLPYAPYMETVERLNLAGARLPGGRLPVPPPLAAEVFAARAPDAWVVDTRDLMSFSAAHVPGALALWENELSNYAGWFLTQDKPILLVCDTDRIDQVTRYLVRLGFDRIEGVLAGGMLAWQRAGMESQSVRTLTVQSLCRRLDGAEPTAVLDVRTDEEVEATPIPEALHIPIKQVPLHLDEVPSAGDVCIFCGSGVRSVIAASLLRRAGRDNASVVLGGIAGWNSTSCPLPLS